MPDNKQDDDRTRAKAIFRLREFQKADAPKAVQDYQVAQQAIRDRTKKLRQMRLAREVQAVSQKG